MKLKKSVKIVIFIIILLLALLIVKNNFSKSNNHKNNYSSKENIKKNNKDDITSKCKKIKYCNTNYIDRYKKYQKNNKNLSFNDVVVRVNLNLDYSFYTHTKKTPYLNKDYILVNKYLYLGGDYVPDNLTDISTEYSRSGMKLVSNAKNSFEKLAEQAKKDGYPVIAMSSYRSYEYQVNLYNRYVASDGVEAADTYSARPGYSEHQTGLCVDVYDGKIDYTNFEDSASFKWMQDNAYKYGFILRFPKDKTNITGYQYESWHYRYVGTKIAKYIHENDITLEEYYAMFIEPKYKSKFHQ